jgi:hypothetical protein
MKRRQIAEGSYRSARIPALAPVRHIMKEGILQIAIPIYSTPE